MKKLIGVLLLAFSLVGCCFVAEASVGDINGEAVYTDICAYINHYPISAYAANGTMVVVAEDLNNYGMNVVWNDSERRLDISLTDKKIVGMQGVYNNKRKIGKKFSDLFETDIKVYANGCQLPSYSLNGYTLVPIESLACLGSFTYDDSTRSAKLWLDGKHVKNFVVPMERCKKIYDSGALNNLQYLELWEDINADGEADPIKMSTTNNYYGNIDSVRIQMGGATYYIGIMDNSYYYNVYSIYLCDLSPADNKIELVVLYECEDGSIEYFVYQYDGVSVKKISNEIRYTNMNYFDVLDNGAIVATAMSNTTYAFNLYFTYCYNGNEIVQVEEDYYKIANYLHGYQDPSEISYVELVNWGYLKSLDEYLKLMNGWIKANATYYNYYTPYNSTRNVISLNKGDYFRCVYDDDNDWVFIEKIDGTSGWIYLGGFGGNNVCNISRFLF